MVIKSFEVSDLHELRVMQRVFREAKFCTVADDDEISDSPIVASLFSRLLAVLVEAEVEIDGENARQSWDRWLMMDNPSRNEWTSARLRAQENHMWDTMPESEKITYVKILFSPFVLSDDAIRQFVTEVNNSKTVSSRGKMEPNHD
jgi:hypothetical protein